MNNKLKFLLLVATLVISLSSMVAATEQTPNVIVRIAEENGDVTITLTNSENSDLTVFYHVWGRMYDTDTVFYRNIAAGETVNISVYPTQEETHYNPEGADKFAVDVQIRGLPGRNEDYSYVFPAAAYMLSNYVENGQGEVLSLKNGVLSSSSPAPSQRRVVPQETAQETNKENAVLWLLSFSSLLLATVALVLWWRSRKK